MREVLNYETSGFHCTKKTEHEHESKYKRKVANIILLLW